MVIAAGLFVEFCLVAAGFFAWCRVVLKTRGLFWEVLLEKYPARPDVCVAVLLDSLDSFVIANLVVGGRSMGISDCPVLVGEKGLHLAESVDLHFRIGRIINDKYIFIPWSRLQTEDTASCLRVLGTGDRLVFRSVEDAKRALRPYWKRDESQLRAG